jgi:hypothetical protein
MQTPEKRTIFTVCPVTGGWAVEHDGVVTDKARDKAVAQASAAKLARAAMAEGQAVQVRIEGETGYF